MMASITAAAYYAAPNVTVAVVVFTIDDNRGEVSIVDMIDMIIISMSIATKGMATPWYGTRAPGIAYDGAGAATTGPWTGCDAAVSGAPQLSQNFALGVAGVPHCAHFSSFMRFTSFALLDHTERSSFNLCCDLLG